MSCKAMQYHTNQNMHKTMRKHAPNWNLMGGGGGGRKKHGEYVRITFYFISFVIVFADWNSKTNILSTFAGSFEPRRMGNIWLQWKINEWAPHWHSNASGHVALFPLETAFVGENARFHQFNFTELSISIRSFRWFAFRGRASLWLLGAVSLYHLPNQMHLMLIHPRNARF